MSDLSDGWCRVTVTTGFFCPYLDSDVELTDDRERHIAERHPDLLPGYRERIVQTLADPDEVRCDVRFDNTLLFSRRYDRGRRGKYVVVVVVTDTVPLERNWIVTAYISRTITQGEIIWQRN